MRNTFQSSASEKEIGRLPSRPVLEEGAARAQRCSWRRALRSVRLPHNKGHVSHSDSDEPPWSQREKRAKSPYCEAEGVT